MEKEYDAIIIGAGAAGLAAASKLREEGKSFIILEATDHIGGRVMSQTTPDGTVVNTGANWLHGKEQDAMFPIAQELGLTIDTSDEVKNVVSFSNGKAHQGEGFRFFQKIRTFLGAVNNLPEFISKQDISLEQIIGGKSPDKDRKSISNYLYKTFAGGNDPNDLSAKQAILDPYGPGGYQIKEGMGELMHRIAKRKVGIEHIHLNTPVTKVIDKEDGATVVTKNGEEIKAKQVVFSGSIGVIKSGIIGFEKDSGEKLFDDNMKAQLNSLKMGNMTKLVFELDAGYIASKPQLHNRHIDFFDAEPPMFVHVASSGKPIVTVFLGGNDAIDIQKELSSNPEKTIEAILKQLERKGTGLEDCREHISKTPALVTSWDKNDYVQGAYSNCMVGGKRTGPVTAGNHVILCGEAFAGEKSAYLSGAWESGEKAAEMAIGIETTKHWTETIKNAIGIKSYSQSR